MNFRQPNIPLIMGVVFLIEINRRYLFKKSLPAFVAGSYLCGLLTSLLLIVLSPNLSVGTEILVLEPTILVGLYAFSYPVIVKFVQKKIFKSQLLYEESQAELNALKAQVNPHFLFNSLNSIYALALQEKAEKTGEAIGELSDMMRHVLELQQEELTPIEKEADFMEQFIRLQKLRLPEENRNGIQFYKNIKDTDRKLPHLIFLPLLENAFKYGISSKEPAEIQIDLNADKDKVEFQIKNRVMNEHSGLGTGLKNLEKRLDLIYDSDYELQQNVQNGTYSVHLKIKY